MTKENLNSKLFDTAVMAFQEMCLMFPDQELTDEQKAAKLDVGVAVEFEGSSSGKLLLRVSSSILPEMAANMLGADESPPVEQQYDAAKEIANIICGNIVPAVCGPEGLYNLRAPKLVDAGDGAEIPGEPAARAVVGMEDGRAEVLLYIYGEATGEGTTP